MSTTTPRKALAIAVSAFAALAAPSVSADSGVSVVDAWARATPPGATTGAAYARILAESADRLTAARSGAARAVEIHATAAADGVVTMRRIDALPIPAHEPVELAPGGAHLMLIDLAAPLVPGADVALTLVFEKAGEITVSLPVVDARATHGSQHHAH